MTQDEILEALHKVVAENTHYTTWTVSTPHLVLLVNLAIEKEREACAKVCEQTNDGTPYNLAEACAEAIRARGNT
jgi:bacteriorhodopsin